MDANLTSYFFQQGPFAVLFVCSLIWMRKDGKDRETQLILDSKEREKKLYKTIEDQNEVLSKFSNKYDVIIDKLGHLEQKLGN